MLARSAHEVSRHLKASCAVGRPRLVRSAGEQAAPKKRQHERVREHAHVWGANLELPQFEIQAKKQRRDAEGVGQAGMGHIA